MKKIFWTTVFWLIVFFGFTLYIKWFDANMAIGVSTWLGATEITTSGEAIPTTGTTNEVMSGINAIQTTLNDMQVTLKTLAPATTPVVETPSVTSTTGTKVAE